MKIYTLPFSDVRAGLPGGDVVTSDDAGARAVALHCCKLAKINRSQIETEAEYAWQMAAFIVGHMAASEDRQSRKLFLFSEFLQMVEDWLEVAYPDDQIDSDPDLSYDAKIFELGGIQPAHLRTRI